ncbi:MAG: hypothetical protein NT149_03325 [Candidatus Gottesmanbacteria bacterium]|nr:hypothetical protein [Candidatus Gottesmanbacteria bacterium]
MTKELKRGLTITELGAHLIRQSRLALLVLPLFTRDRPDPTPDFAREFADAFNLVILQEGKPAFNFINGLDKKEKEKMISVLIQGGMVGAIYMSGDDIFSVEEKNGTVMP